MVIAAGKYSYHSTFKGCLHFSTARLVLALPFRNLSVHCRQGLGVTTAHCCDSAHAQSSLLSLHN
jgi:hypothetical protein